MKEITLLVLNGPGLADLSLGGDRYGNVTLDEIQQQCSALCSELGVESEFRQTDDQDEMFRWIARDSDHYDALIINPVGYLKSGTVDFDMYRSAIKMIAHLKKPVIEVHLTNIFLQGEEITKPLQGPEGEMGFVCGLGIQSYLLAVKAAVSQLQR